MNRLQKKCFIVSAGFHSLLLLILFVGPAFLASTERPVPSQYIDVIPAKIIEAAFAGGGDPKAKPPPPTPRVQPQQTVVQPPPTPPQKPERKEVAKDPPPKDESDSLEVSKDQKQRKPKVSTQVVTRNRDSKTKPKETSDAQQQAQARAENAARRAAVFSAYESLKDGQSSATKIGIHGPGGEAYAGYEIVLQSIYKKYYDQALAAAGDIATGHSEVEVSVVIARDGNVLSSRLVTPSGNAALDRLVRRVLDTVTFIRPFPETSTDPQRTFTIVFDLKPQRAIG